MIGCISTGSRGAFVVISVFTIIVVMMESEGRLKTRKIGIINILLYVLLLSILIGIGIFVAYIFGSRSLFFNINNTSEASRVGYYVLFFSGDYIENIFDVFWGVSSGNGGFKNYPHNIVIESFVWGGVTMLSLVIFSMLWTANALIRGRGRVRQYGAIVAIIFVSSLLSGSFVDNYPAVSMALSGAALFGWRLSNTQKWAPPRFL
jgi:hypothetical protein